MIQPEAITDEYLEALEQDMCPFCLSNHAYDDICQKRQDHEEWLNQLLGIDLGDRE